MTSAPVRWISEQAIGEQIGFRLGRCDDGLVAEFVGIGTLSARRDGHQSTFTPAHGADPIAVNKLQQSLLPALLRHLTKKLTLHGSAVAWRGLAISCIGESGTGKSTTAAALCTGFDGEFVADDTSAVEFGDAHAELVPTERMHWLVSGSIDPDPQGHIKRAVVPRASASKNPRLAAICRLLFDDAAPGAELLRVRGQEALAAVLPSVIRFVLDEPAMQEHEFEQLGRLARTVPIYVLRRPRRAAEIQSSCQALVTLMHALSKEAEEEP